MIRKAVLIAVLALLSVTVVTASPQVEYVMKDGARSQLSELAVISETADKISLRMDVGGFMARQHTINTSVSPCV